MHHWIIVVVIAVVVTCTCIGVGIVIVIYCTCVGVGFIIVIYSITYVIGECVVGTGRGTLRWSVIRREQHGNVIMGTVYSLRWKQRCGIDVSCYCFKQYFHLCWQSRRMGVVVAGYMPQAFLSLAL